MDDKNDTEPRYRVGDLEPRLQRLAALILARPPGHRRRKPDPENISRPELQVLDRARAMHVAIEQHSRDQSQPGRTSRTGRSEGEVAAGSHLEQDRELDYIAEETDP